MGNKTSSSRFGTSPQLIQIPLHIECKSDESYNVATSIPFMYRRTTRMYDLFKRVNEFVSHLHNDQNTIFEISKIDEKSFIGLNIADINKNNWISTAYHKSITMFSQKSIEQKGLFITIKEKGFKSSKGEKPKSSKSSKSKIKTKTKTDRERKPLENITNKYETDKNDCDSNDEYDKDDEAEIDVVLEKRCSALMCEDLAYENFRDIMATLKKKEVCLQLFIDKNYISSCQQNCITWKYRNILIDWLFDLQHDYNFMNATIFTAINYVDCFLSKKKLINRTNLQLLGVTSLMIACKTLEIKPLWMTDWIEIGEDIFTENEFIAMEKTVISVLNWNTFQLTPCDYTQCWLQILNMPIKGNELIFKNCVEFIVSSCSIYGQKYVSISKAKLVASAIYLSTIYLPKYKNQINLKLLSKISSCSIKNLNKNDKDIIDLHNVVIKLINTNRIRTQNGEINSVSAIYTKYSSKPRNHIINLNFQQLMQQKN